MSNVKTGVGTQDITLGLIWGDTAQENVSRYSYWGGDNAENSKTETEGGTPHKIKVGCWLAGWFNDYSANPGSILHAETCEILG